MNSNRYIKNFSSAIKLFSIGGPLILIIMTIGIANLNAFSQTSGPNMTSTPGTETMPPGEFSQIVVTSTQIDEINKTIENATKAAEGGNMTEVLLTLKVLENQISLLR